MYDDTKFMLLLTAMMLPGVSRGEQRERTAEDDAKQARQDAMYSEWRNRGGDLSGFGATQRCRCHCLHCGGNR
jgi:hypothetical protein